MPLHHDFSHMAATSSSAAISRVRVLIDSPTPRVENGGLRQGELHIEPQSGPRPGLLLVELASVAPAVVEETLILACAMEDDFDSKNAVVLWLRDTLRPKLRPAVGAARAEYEYSPVVLHGVRGGLFGTLRGLLPGLPTRPRELLLRSHNNHFVEVPAVDLASAPRLTREELHLGDDAGRQCAHFRLAVIAGGRALLAAASKRPVAVRRGRGGTVPIVYVGAVPEGEPPDWHSFPLVHVGTCEMLVGDFIHPLVSRASGNGLSFADEPSFELVRAPLRVEMHSVDVTPEVMDVVGGEGGAEGGGEDCVIEETDDEGGAPPSKRLKVALLS